MHRVSAFTLIELVVVIVIVGLLTSAVIQWPDMTINVDATSQKLRSDIRLIQFMAMSQHQMLQVAFTSGGYTVTESDGSTAVLLPTTNTNSVSYGSGITGTASSANLYFDRLGIPYATTSTALSSNFTITMAGTDGASKTVTIIPETGYATVS